MILLRLRAQARRRWRSWLAWSLVAGLAGGVTVAALAGAQRTATAYERFLDETLAFDVTMTNGGTTPDNVNRQFDFAEVARLPEVETSALLSYYSPRGETADGTAITPAELAPLAAADGHFGVDISRLPMVEGRLPTRDDEIAISPLTSDLLDIGIGDSLSLQLSGPLTPGPPAGELRVVGIVAVQGGFPPLTGGLPPPAILSNDYAANHPDAAQIFAFRLRGGTADIAAFEQQLHRLAGDEEVVTSNRIELSSAVQRGLDVQATALRVFAAIFVSVAGLLLFQALRRQTVVEATHDGIWRALGSTGRQLGAARMVLGLLLAPVAGLAAVAIALALSPLLPIGVARDVEVRPGVEANVAYLAVGMVAVVLAVIVLQAVSSVVQSTLDAPARVRHQVSRRAPRRGLVIGSRSPSLAAASALGVSIEPSQGKGGLSPNSTVVSVAIGIAAIIGVVVFSASLDRLFTEPALYGWGWDLQVGDAFSPALDDLATEIRDDPATESLAVATTGRLTIGTVSVDAIAIDPSSGIDPIVVQGTAPRVDDEIMFGARTLRRLGLGLGDTVTVELGDRAADMRITGRGVLPDFAGAARLGEGASLTLAGFRRLAPEATTDVLLLRIHPGASDEALLGRLDATRSGARRPNLYRPTKPADLVDLERAGGLPSVIAVLFSGAGLLTLAHTLVSATRRRRDHIATLRAIGFVRGQIASIVLWQAVAIAALASLIGVPLGILVGRLFWLVFVDRLGVPNEPVVPVSAAAGLPLVALLAALLTAAVPAWLASRAAHAPASGPG